MRALGIVIVLPGLLDAVLGLLEVRGRPYVVFLGGIDDDAVGVGDQVIQQLRVGVGFGLDDLIARLIEYDILRFGKHTC